jgi:hypothetical protein
VFATKPVCEGDHTPALFAGSLAFVAASGVVADDFKTVNGKEYRLRNAEMRF